MGVEIKTSETKGEKTRQRLREAAARVFARNGYQATRIADIVREAGVTQPTFYLYFDSKEAAYEELVAAFRERLRQTTRHNLIAPATPRETVTDQVALSFHRFLDLLAEDRAVGEIGFFQPPSCRMTKARLVGWVAENVAREQADGLLRADIPAELVARLLVGMLEQFGRIEAAETERRDLALACARLFCEGAGSQAR